MTNFGFDFGLASEAKKIPGHINCQTVQDLCGLRY